MIISKASPAAHNAAQKQRKVTKRKRQDIKLTLGLSELVLLNTGLDSLVELSIESALRRVGDLVVALHILLDRLAAGFREGKLVYCCATQASATGKRGKVTGDDEGIFASHTCYHCALSANLGNSSQ